MTEAQLEMPVASSNIKRSRLPNPALYTVYALALAVSISIWFLGIRSGLFVDETGSFWIIRNGFSHIWPTRSVLLCFPAYYYVLWFFTKILGTSEAALRAPSILAMLGAVYLLYRAACELFDRDTAFIAAIIFCLNPIVIYASADARPYAFGVLTLNAAIFILLRLRNNDSNWMAAFFGIMAALPAYFHYLFLLILPAFAVTFFLIKTRSRRILWRQFGIATAALFLALLPLTPGILYLVNTRTVHVADKPPTILNLLWTLAPEWLPIIFVIAIFFGFIAEAIHKGTFAKRSDPRSALIAACLGLIPILILFGICLRTSMFAEHHRMVAIPGIALCWAYLISFFRAPALRIFFCCALVGATLHLHFTAPHFGHHHGFSKRDALEIVQKNASTDNAPVVICSSFVEADYAPMPVDSPKTSGLFAELSYYKLSVPVIPLPRSLNQEAIRAGSQFLQKAEHQHTRFLALGQKDPSDTILTWLSQQASPAYTVRELGVFDRIEVLEFDPRPK